MNTATANPQATTDTSSTADTSSEASYVTRPQPLYRPLDDRMLAGVATGAARYLHVDVAVMRIILVALVIFGGIGVPLYLAGWLLIPEEGADQSIASEAIQSLQARAR
jgi:phage shock protein PspC (stress-responsive transcriptional regulator)